MARQSDETRQAATDWKRRQRRWAAEFTAARQRSGRSIEAVALSIGVSTQRLTDWIHWRSRINPIYLGRLAEAVDASLLEWAAIFGFVPEGLLATGRALEQANQQLRAAQQRLAALLGESYPTAHILQAAMRSGGWSASSWPWLEGPVGYKLRGGRLGRHSTL